VKAAHTVTFWRHADLAGLELGLISDSAHVFPRHSHDYYAIGCMERGSSYCLRRGDEATCVQTGGLALINPGQIHTGGWPGGAPITYRMFYVDEGLMRAAAQDMAQRPGGWPEFTALVARDPQAWGGLQRLAAVAPAAREPLARQSALYTALGALLLGHAQVRPASAVAGQEPRAVRTLRELLAADLAAPLTLDDLAGAAGLSRYHLLRVFKRATGLPPHAYRTQLRIERAKALLRAGRPMADVAQDCGFADQAHFANRFRQFTGATPGQYVAA